MITKKNYYDVLEILPSASAQEIKDAYRRSYNSYSGESVAMYSLMSKDECDEILSQIEEAFSILGDPNKRKEYDSIRGLNQNVDVNRDNDFTYSNQNQPAQNNVTTVNFDPGQATDTSPSPQEHRSEQRINSNLLEETFGKAQVNSNSDLINVTQELATEMKKDVSTDKAKFTYNQEAQQKSEANVSKFTALKKFTLDFSHDTDFEQQIENATDFKGTFLKKIREYKNVSIQRMAEMTRISKTYIKHIEEDDFEKLPADVYTRGFVYQYAKCLKLNPDLVASSYLHYVRQNRTSIAK